MYSNKNTDIFVPENKIEDYSMPMMMRSRAPRWMLYMIDYDIPLVWGLPRTIVLNLYYSIGRKLYLDINIKRVCIPVISLSREVWQNVVQYFRVTITGACFTSQMISIQINSFLVLYTIFIYLSGLDMLTLKVKTTLKKHCHLMERKLEMLNWK